MKIREGVNNTQRGDPLDLRPKSENKFEGVPVNSGAIKDLYDNHATYF